MDIVPENVVKFSGIGCSSKSPTYFLNRSFGFNGLHGRMPSLATGACLPTTRLKGIGVSGDGDTASIGMGQFKHVLRRNRAHGLHRREQWRVWPDQRPVLRDRRRRAWS